MKGEVRILWCNERSEQVKSVRSDKISWVMLIQHNPTDFIGFTIVCCFLPKITHFFTQIFGWSFLETVDAPGKLGLRDLALLLVNKNIEAFSNQTAKHILNF